MGKEDMKTWIVAFYVYKYWTDDGFNLTEEVAKQMIETALPYSVKRETAVKILKTPKG